MTGININLSYLLNASSISYASSSIPSVKCIYLPMTTSRSCHSVLKWFAFVLKDEITTKPSASAERTLILKGYINSNNVSIRKK